MKFPEFITIPEYCLKYQFLKIRDPDILKSLAFCGNLLFKNRKDKCQINNFDKLSSLSRVYRRFSWHTVIQLPTLISYFYQFTLSAKLYLSNISICRYSYIFSPLLPQPNLLANRGLHYSRDKGVNLTNSNILICSPNNFRSLYCKMTFVCVLFFFILGNYTLIFINHVNALFQGHNNSYVLYL